MKKIIQIIPAPQCLYAIYNDNGKEFKSPVVCLALVEKDNEQWVEPMTNQGMYIDFEDSNNFIGFEVIA